jgi:23S rRNA pseudouridine2605 synthase
MEEKKRRPRLTKPDQGFPLKERPKNSESDQDERSEEIFERKPLPDQERPFERKPFNNDRPFNRDRNEGGGGFERKPYQDRSRESGFERKPFNNDRQDGGGGFNKRPFDNDRPRYGDRDKPVDRNREGGFERKPFNNDRPDNTRRPYNNDRPDNNTGGGGYRRPYNNDRPDNNTGGGGYRRPYDNDRPDNTGGGGYRRPYDNDRPRFGGGNDRKPFNKSGGGGFKKPFNKKPFGRKDEFYVEKKPKPNLPSGEGMPLNKYLAHCGISSRRKAVEYIQQGEVTVNGEVKTEPFYRIQPADAVVCQGKPVQIQERQVYVLLNKPKNVITSTDDDRGRTTVLDIVDSSFPERLFPVGRLDRDTTGLILITNDGDLAQKLSHPSHNIQKHYRVGLDRPFSMDDEKRIEQDGVELEDGLMKVNWIRFSEDHPDRDVVEVEISSGRNRIIRRLFEALGYDVRKLDRFYFAGLTKKDLPRGSFRELTQREIVMLKHFTGHPSTGKKKDLDTDDESDAASEPDQEDPA